MPRGRQQPLHGDERPGRRQRHAHDVQHQLPRDGPVVGRAQDVDGAPFPHAAARRRRLRFGLGAAAAPHACACGPVARSPARRRCGPGRVPPQAPVALRRVKMGAPAATGKARGREDEWRRIDDCCMALALAVTCVSARAFGASLRAANATSRCGRGNCSEVLPPLRYFVRHLIGIRAKPLKWRLASVLHDVSCPFCGVLPLALATGHSRTLRGI